LITAPLRPQQGAEGKKVWISILQCSAIFVGETSLNLKIWLGAKIQTKIKSRRKTRPTHTGTAELQNNENEKRFQRDGFLRDGFNVMVFYMIPSLHPSTDWYVEIVGQFQRPYGRYQLFALKGATREG